MSVGYVILSKVVPCPFPSCYTTIHCVPVAVAQVGEGSILNLPCAKDQVNENCEHRSGIMKGIPQHVLPVAFSSCPSAPPSIYAFVCKVLIG